MKLGGAVVSWRGVQDLRGEADAYSSGRNSTRLWQWNPDCPFQVAGYEIQGKWFISGLKTHERTE